MLLITHMHTWAEGADVRKLCHVQPPAFLNGQSISTKPKSKQSAHASVTPWAAEHMALAPNQSARTNEDVCAT